LGNSANFTRLEVFEVGLGVIPHGAETDPGEEDRGEPADYWK